MQIGTPFGTITREPSWFGRVAIGALVGLIPFVGVVVLNGYCLRLAEVVAARAMNRNPEDASGIPLPDWSSEDFGALLMRGLSGMAVALVYGLPFIIIATLSSCIPIIALIAFIPLMLFAVVTGMLTSVGLARLIEHGSLGEALKIGDAVATLREDAGPWFTIILVQILAGLVASMGLLACGVGIIFTGAFAQCVVGAALGLTMAERRRKLEMSGAPIGPNSPA
jgi:hypothetical protein